MIRASAQHQVNIAGSGDLGSDASISTVPKSGTHLLVPVVEQALDKKAVTLPRMFDGEHLSEMLARSGNPELSLGHIRCGPNWSPLPDDLRTVVLLRDPRDVLLSMRDFLLHPKRIREGHLLAAAAIRDLEPDDQLIRLAKGVENAVAPIQVHNEGFLYWKGRNAAFLRFEQLFDDAAPGLVGEALGMPKLVDRLAEAFDAIRGKPSKTLNVGRPGRWRTAMSPAVQDYVRHHTGNIVERMGYGWD